MGHKTLRCMSRHVMSVTFLCLKERFEVVAVLKKFGDITIYVKCMSDP